MASRCLAMAAALALFSATMSLTRASPRVAVETAGYMPDPPEAPVDFVCAYRSLAAEYAAMLRPDFDAGILFDALQLGTLCNKTRPAAQPALPHRVASAAAAGMADNAVYVSTTGDDKNPGTKAAPKRTVLAGLEATRSLAAPKSLLLGDGTYYLQRTLQLDGRDSGLTIAPTSGTKDSVWLSGALPLPLLKWSE